MFFCSSKANVVDTETITDLWAAAGETAASNFPSYASLTTWNNTAGDDEDILEEEEGTLNSALNILGRMATQTNKHSATTAKPTQQDSSDYSFWCTTSWGRRANPEDENQAHGDSGSTRAAAEFLRIVSNRARHDEGVDGNDDREPERTDLPFEVMVYKPKHQLGGTALRDLKITWSVDRHREMGLVDKWTGSLLLKQHTSMNKPEEPEQEIGWITVYSIRGVPLSQRSVISDYQVQTFCQHFLIPNVELTPPAPPGAAVTFDSEDQNYHYKNVNITTGNTPILPQQNHDELLGANASTTQLQLSSPMEPIFLVTDMTIQPKHRGCGLGLFLLDGACRRVARESSLVVVSLREAIDERLHEYFGLLGFAPPPPVSAPTVAARRQQQLPWKKSSSHDSARTSATTTTEEDEAQQSWFPHRYPGEGPGAHEYVVRRNGPQCPTIDEICPHFPSTIVSVVPSTSPVMAMRQNTLS
uniref:Uncharacterized protein n=1 Tax=Entomoneis paludosa TaxID=265537 RepID=A0A7S2YKM5_9STRA